MSNEKEQLLMQLKGLREDCIKEHFEDKLEAIASKEVVHDILADFLSVNQDQFIESISSSILEVKKANQLLTEQMQALIETHQLELDSLREQRKKDLTSLEQLRDGLKAILNGDDLIGEVKSLISNYNRLVEDIELKHQTLCKVQQELIQYKNNEKVWSQEKKQCAIELLSFEAYRNDTAAELKAHINANQWLEQEHKRLRQELEAIKAVSKESESNLIGKHSQAINEISRLNSKLNMLQQQKNQLSAKQTTVIQSLELQKKGIIRKSEQAQHEITLLRKKLADEEKEKIQIKEKLKHANNESTASKQEIILLKIEIKSLEQQIRNLSMQNGLISAKLTHTQEDIKNHLANRDSMSSQLNKIIQTLQTSKQQAQAYAQFNEINKHQQSQLEEQLKAVKIQNKMIEKQLIDKHLQAISSLENELNQAKFIIFSLNQRIKEANVELEHKKQLEKHYQIYLAEISQLKNQLTLSNRPVKNRTRFALSKLSYEVVFAKQEFGMLRNVVIKEVAAIMRSMKSDMVNQLRQLFERSITCSYCTRKSLTEQNGQNLKQTEVFLSPKVSQQLRQTQDYPQLKRKLKKINERARQVQQLNSTFSTHVQGFFRKKEQMSLH